MLQHSNGTEEVRHITDGDLTKGMKINHVINHTIKFSSLVSAHVRNVLVLISSTHAPHLGVWYLEEKMRKLQFPTHRQQTTNVSQLVARAAVCLLQMA